MCVRNRKLLCLAACAALVVFRTGADPLKNPHRMVEGRSVDLRPLFEWWHSHSGPRPLTAWVQVSGSITATNAWGWVVSSAEGKILLRDPPLQDLAKFEQLHGRLKALEARHAGLASEEAHAKADAKAAGGANGRRNRARAAVAARARQVEVQDQAQIKDLDVQMQALKKALSAYPNTDHYAVDCVALKTALIHDGLRVFEHGSTLP